MEGGELRILRELGTPGLSDSARVAGMFLLLHRDPKSGRCYPSIDTIARKMGCSRSKAIRSLNELKVAGILTSRATNHSNEYSFSVAPRVSRYASIWTATGAELKQMTLDAQERNLKLKGMWPPREAFSGINPDGSDYRFEIIEDYLKNEYHNPSHAPFVGPREYPPNYMDMVNKSIAELMTTANAHGWHGPHMEEQKRWRFPAKSSSQAVPKVHEERPPSTPDTLASWGGWPI